MDTFENDTFPEEPRVPEDAAQEPAPQNAAPETPPAQPEQPQAAPQSYQPPQPDPYAYRGAGAGRRESPYADSPYVTGQRPQEQQGGYQYQNQYQPYPPYQGQPQYHYQPQTQPPQKPPKKKKERSSKGVGRKILALVLVCALVAGGCLITAGQVNAYWEKRTATMERRFDEKMASMQKQLDSRPAAPGSSGASQPMTDGMTPAQLYESCVDSVVAISSTVQTQSYYGTTEGAASGSGFILSEDGYIVTNYHVVENATAITVTCHDGTEYAAELVGKDAANDVAVLKTDAEGLSAAVIGSSDALAIGDMVAAIGNPLGELTATQTIGYVSGIGREVTTDNTIISMIQTDAAINPGNSGGPLFDMYGQVIGITTAKYSGTTGSGASIEGIGFAIPIDDIKSIIADLIDYGYVTGAYLGVTVENIDSAMVSKYGLPTGAYVRTVEPGYAAQKAGVQVKDIIVELGGKSVTSITDLTRALRGFKAGDTTTITVVRGGSRMTLDITLDEKPQTMPEVTEEAPTAPASPSEDDMFDAFRRFFGG